MGGDKGVGEHGVIEKGGAQEEGDTAGDGTDDSRRVRRTGVVGGEDDRAGRNALDTLHSYADADGIHKKHDSLDGRPVKRIGIFCEHSVNEQRRPEDEDIKREEHEHESGTQHGLLKLSGIRSSGSRGDVSEMQVAPASSRPAFFLGWAGRQDAGATATGQWLRAVTGSVVPWR